MARFKTGGIAAQMKRFDALAKGTDAACSAAVKAGGKLLAETLKTRAPVRTGALRDSIRATKVEYNAEDGYHCEVAPQGNHPATGEPLAKIGNILEYGRSYGRTVKAGLGWFNPTVAACEQQVITAMQDVFDRETRG